ncbi:EF-hand domain-containing protein [Hoeflea prorocentri]|uniref:EF-hand domain-containing protein n=1 Tax=Hoeflea prorocentri TaxID=1922333 RepID=A0A9X3UIB0_9HYPH|nr:EF-hand domain-containing protein [Hoeflea prorocentri]MCY6381172.1 EF-hand domain-containing protein [Hoeflea prorocentri]MDA5398972.1 EF-hand domain-containing protein [Hoeflea prorocentri]
MSTPKKILVSLMATSFLGASLVPALAQSGTPGNKPVAEKRMAHAGAGKHGKRQRGAMKRAFERYDVNKDGVITQEEVDAVIVERFNAFSGDDDTISLEDFRAAWLDQSRDRMVRAFQRLDRDGDGAISAEEYDTASERMFSRLDRDGDGELTRPAKGDQAKAGGKHGKKGKMAKRGGPRHGQGAARLMERFDTDKDGKITRAEFDAVRAEIFGGADADGNQAVSLEEFTTIWQGMNDNRIVRGFQRYDADGDLSITLEEYTAGNADFVKKHDRNGDGVVTKADMKGGKHKGKRSGQHMKKGKDRASMQKPMKPVQPVQPDTQG